MAGKKLPTAQASCVFAVVSFTALFGASYCQTFTVHPRNATTLFDRTVTFACEYTTATFEPEWRAVAEGSFGSTLSLTYQTTLGVYSYILATNNYAELNVRADRNTPGLNNTCLSCRFTNAGIVESGKGCLIIAAPPLKPFVSATEIEFSSITLGWQDPWSHYPIQNYTLELQNAEGVQLSTRLVEKGTLSYKVTGLVGATRYRFRLRANSEAGSGTWSDAISEETSANSNQALSTEVIGIIAGCVVAVVVVVIVIIAVVSFVCCW